MRWAVEECGQLYLNSTADDAARCILFRILKYSANKLPFSDDRQSNFVIREFVILLEG